jgi:hypothetical protein
VLPKTKKTKNLNYIKELLLILLGKIKLVWVYEKKKKNFLLSFVVLGIELRA